LAFYPKPFIDIQKVEDVKRSEDNAFEEVSKEWENFESGIMALLTRCKSFLGRHGSLK